MSAVFELAMAGRHDEALGVARRLVEQDRSNPALHTLLGMKYARVGLYPEAVAAFQVAVKLGDDSGDTQILLGDAYAKAGAPRKTRDILVRLEAGEGYVSPVGLAVLYAALGERDQAFALLERAYSAHDQQLKWLGVERGLVPLRDDPRFRDLLRRVGVARSRN